MTDIAEQIKKNRESFEREARLIRGDLDITGEAKARRIRPLYEEAKRVENQLRQQRRIDLANRVNAAERAVFATPKAFGSDASLAAMSYRAALDSVENLTDPWDLSDRLERAAVVGDEALARAVAWRANNLGLGHITQAYLETNPDAAQKYQAWVDVYDELHQVETQGEALTYGELELQLPEELGGVDVPRRREESGLDTVLAQAMSQDT